VVLSWKPFYAVVYELKENDNTYAPDYGNNNYFGDNTIICLDCLPHMVLSCFKNASQNEQVTNQCKWQFFQKGTALC
jgi:hypothetical protein